MKILVECGEHGPLKKALKILKKYDLEISETPDVLFSIGGDGTYIRNYKDKKFKTPILPIRTPGSLGYIADIDIEDLDRACEKLADKKFYIEKRTMLDVYKNERKMGTAINDVTITQTPTGAMWYRVDFYAYPLFDRAIIIGDGVTVATPTGSTGYNKSEGGYILKPDSKKIVATLRHPFSLGPKEKRSKILDNDSTIVFQFYRPERALLIIDNESSSIRSSDYIFIRKSDETFDFVRIRGMEESRRLKERRRTEWFEKQLF